MTAQIRDKILIDGVEHTLDSGPCLSTRDCDWLEDFWANFDTHYILINTPTCLHRGYVATWEIRDERLYLNHLSSGQFRLLRPPPIFVDWFSGTILVDQGEPLITHVNHSSIYERHLHIQVVGGYVTGWELVDYDPEKDAAEWEARFQPKPPTSILRSLLRPGVRLVDSFGTIGLHLLDLFKGRRNKP